MSLIQGIKFDHIADDGTPVFDIDFNLQFDGASPQTEEPADYIRDVFGPLPAKVSMDQLNTMRSVRNFAAALSRIMLLRNPNRIKYAFHGAFSAIILNDPSLTASVNKWDRDNFNYDRESKVKNLKEHLRIFIAAGTVVGLAQLRGVKVNLEAYSILQEE